MKKIQVKLIGFVKRESDDENDRDRSLTSRIIINKSLTKHWMGLMIFLTSM